MSLSLLETLCDYPVGEGHAWMLIDAHVASNVILKYYNSRNSSEWYSYCLQKYLHAVLRSVFCIFPLYLWLQSPWWLWSSWRRGIYVRILHSVWLVASHVLIPTKVTLVARQGGHSTKPQGPPRPPVQLPGGQRWCPNTSSPHPSLSSLLLPVLYLTLHQGQCGRRWPNGQMQSSTHQNLTPTLQPGVCEGDGPLLPGSLYVPPTVKELPYPR